jgi:ABC-type phosphate transport system auxiliary subunit
MPCMTPEPTNREIIAMEIRRNKSLYGYNMTTNNLISELINTCCDMGERLEDAGLIDRISGASYQVYNIHKNFDRMRKDAERKKQKQEIDKKKMDLIELEKKLDDLRWELDQLT